MKRGASASAHGHQWPQAKQMIEEDPSLVSSGVFQKTLENNPPAELVRFMISVNPEVVGIPNEGPTALQVAVQNGASLSVVEILLEVCPFALRVTNPKHSLDPLSYAKIHLKHDVELINLLSRPIHHWTSRCKGNTFRRSRIRGDPNACISQYKRRGENFKMYPPSSLVARSHQPKGKDKLLGLLRKEKEEEPPRGSQVSDPNDPKALPAMSSLLQDFDERMVAGECCSRRIDREELNNVKLLCAQVLKGHKSLSKQVKICQEMLRNQSKRQQPDHRGLISIQGAANSAPLDASLTFYHERVFKGAKEEQQRQFRTQLIALDMKEQAFRAHVRKSEERYKQQMSSWKRGINSWMLDTEDKMKEYCVVLDHEMKVNAKFRSGLNQWIDDHELCNVSSLSKNDDCSLLADESSYLFATNLGEVNERIPLCAANSCAPRKTCCYDEKDLYTCTSKPSSQKWLWSPLLCKREK